MNSSQLKEVAKILKSYPHYNETEELKTSFSTWADSGFPYLWRKVESDGEYTIFKDTAHGYLAVFVGNKFHACGMHRIITKSCVVIDKKYYPEASNYLYKPASKAV